MNEKYVLLVEDDQDIRELVTEALDLAGIKSKAAVNGEDAIEKLKLLDQKPSLILLDLMMPKTDGIWFCKERKKYEALTGIPVVILTADNSVEAKTADLGIDGILKKPVRIDDLLGTAQRYLH